LSTRWLDWGGNASFAPEWDDGGVGGGFGAEGIALDWAYKRLRRTKRQKETVEPVVDSVPEVIDEKLLLAWEESEPPKDLEGELVVEETDMSVDESLEGLRGMITLLGQMQTLRMAMGKTEVPEEEQALGMPSINYSNCSRKHRRDIPIPDCQSLDSTECTDVLAPCRCI
jgi:hypothetical protein